MKKVFFILALSLILLVGCADRNTKPTEEPGKTPVSTLAPTNTAAPTATLEPTATPTVIPEPSATPAVTPGTFGMFTPDNIPIIDGATATAPFYQEIVAHLLGMDVEQGKAYCLCSTTTMAYENLMNGTVDMVVGAKPSAEQEAAAKEKGVEFEYYHILNGGFVFFVSVDNPVDSLTQEQIKGIYTGKITNWKELGGKDEEIVPFQRDEGSGSQTGLYRYVAPREEIIEAPHDLYFGSMDYIIDAMSAFDYGPAAIGYSYYYYVANMYYRDFIKLIKVDGVMPSNEIIGNGTYPYLNHVVAAVRKGTPADSDVFKVIDFMKSKEGSEIADALGYVSLR